MTRIRQIALDSRLTVRSVRYRELGKWIDVNLLSVKSVKSVKSVVKSVQDQPAAAKPILIYNGDSLRLVSFLFIPRRSPYAPIVL